ncbi:hypothetical protein E2C01_025929 [Portunus trituberculatus]|uniref:Uncharacterized protein n=1 Tax=Portunus trituberculatus TaxID=210409 RepID=A0A5B7EE91_PORTR|nr:hypothetical protein [Portunus trituberculatus]
MLSEPSPSVFLRGKVKTRIRVPSHAARLTAGEGSGWASSRKLSPGRVGKQAAASWSSPPIAQPASNKCAFVILNLRCERSCLAHSGCLIKLMMKKTSLALFCNNSRRGSYSA